MESWLAYCLLAAPIPVGAVSAFRELLAVVHARDEVGQYLNDFVEWCNGGGKSAERYASLLERSGVIQDRLGVYGRAAYRPPFENFVIHDYAILLNGIRDLSEEYARSAERGHSPTLSSRVNAIDACLRQRLGALEARRRQILRGFLNPLALYVGGVRAIVRIPFAILGAAGLVADDSPKAGWLLRLLTGVGSLVLTAFAVVKALRDLGWITI